MDSNVPSTGSAKMDFSPYNNFAKALSAKSPASYFAELMPCAVCF